MKVWVVTQTDHAIYDGDIDYTFVVGVYEDGWQASQKAAEISSHYGQSSNCEEYTVE